MDIVRPLPKQNPDFNRVLFRPNINAYVVRKRTFPIRTRIFTPKSEGSAKNALLSALRFRDQVFGPPRSRQAPERLTGKVFCDGG
jgi:hypothetical protein